jgi:hypothetical protein
LAKLRPGVRKLAFGFAARFRCQRDLFLADAQESGLACLFGFAARFSNGGFIPLEDAIGLPL